MASTHNLRSAIDNLSAYANDLDMDNGTYIDAQSVFINNYQAAAITPEAGWRPAQGSNLSDSMYIVLDRMDFMYQELENIRAENVELTNTISEMSNEINELRQFMGENELGLSA